MQDKCPGRETSGVWFVGRQICKTCGGLVRISRKGNVPSHVRGANSDIISRYQDKYDAVISGRLQDYP